MPVCLTCLFQTEKYDIGTKPKYIQDLRQFYLKLQEVKSNKALNLGIVELRKCPRPNDIKKKRLPKAKLFTMT